MRKLLLAGLFLLGANFVAHAQTDRPKPAYDFSLPREDRIRLAESAAPPEISGKATVYLLERNGYVKVREGTNGFSCFVDRQTPFNMEPTCFDAERSATTLRSRLYAGVEHPDLLPGHVGRESLLAHRGDDGFSFRETIDKTCPQLFFCRLGLLNRRQ